ncbi:MAG: Spermidine/putrescine import ATP-binding protein potA [Polaromonas sp.]|nr:Spermidine/putrescine import ATP-binding protein potA [Polaromonas sp.]
MSNAFIQLSDVTLRYGAGTVALDHTTLGIDKGDFVALVGPSGCGKSTILKLVAGLLQPSAGAVIASGREVGAAGTTSSSGAHASRSPRLRVGLAFQNPTMLPWLNIRDNVMIPLKIVEPFRQDFRKKKSSVYADHVEALLTQVGLKGFGDKRPWQLSGGMLQRASLCRALVHDPELLLLDEPFGALDQFTREELWDIMQKLWMDRRPTVLLVTHDLRESAYLANRICVMSSRPGRILETRDVGFARPRTLESSYSPEFATLVQQLRMRIADARRDGDATMSATAASKVEEMTA